MNSSSGETPISSASVFHLSKQEIEEESLRATNGNVASAIRLYNYYTFSSFDQEQSTKWLRLAATGGDRVSQFNLAMELARNGETNEALHWAEILKSENDPRADDLIAKIKSGIK